MAKSVSNYGVLVAPIGTTDSPTSMTKATFFARLEAEYPSAEWQVVDRSITVIPGGETIVMAYHVERID